VGKLTDFLNLGGLTFRSSIAERWNAKEEREIAEEVAPALSSPREAAITHGGP
jgi:hypothetical protein